jgi:hypothetical protein
VTGDLQAFEALGYLHGLISMRRLRRHVKLVMAAVNAAKPGTYREVEIPTQ